jgi:hypothetical protein
MLARKTVYSIIVSRKYYKAFSCTIELKGSQSSKKSVDILCKSFIDLSIKKENIKEVNDDLLCVEISIENSNGLGLGQDFLQKCMFKVINPQNIKQIFYAKLHKFDGTYDISPISQRSLFFIGYNSIIQS